ncbi:MAG: tetratricopeptide repeat protein [Deltaproteobacteria bacterium]|nr:tetratricopeptide repeat protein [Deltaproteobacteria bacterium]
MRFYCVQCKKSFQPDDLTGNMGGNGLVCPVCGGPLQELKTRGQQAWTRRDRYLTPTAPGKGKEKPDNRKSSDAGQAEGLTDTLIAPDGATIYDEPTVPGAESRLEPEKKNSMSRAPVSQPKKIESGPAYGDDILSAPPRSPDGLPGIVPPTALGGPQRDAPRFRKDTGTGLSDVFSPVGAFDPKSGKIIATSEVAKPGESHVPIGMKPEITKGIKARSAAEAYGGEDNMDSLGNIALPGAPDMGSLELDMSKTKRIPARKVETPGVKPHANVPAIPVSRGQPVIIPGWARILGLIVVLGLTAILVIELTGRNDDEGEFVQAPAVDPLEEIATEMARADKLIRGNNKKFRDLSSTRKKRNVKSRSISRGKTKKRARSKSTRHNSRVSSRNRKAALKFYSSGNESLKMGKLQEAIRNYKAALKADPGFYFAHRGLGAVYATLNRRQDALEQYRLYVKMAPASRDVERVKILLQQAK